MISIFTPTHKPTYLPEIYSSLKDQTDSDWEWIILLNGGAVISPGEEWTQDPRIKIHEDTTGITNVGYLKRVACGHCQGLALMELDHDDLLMPEAVAECARAFQDPTVDFVYSNSINHDVRYDKPVTWGAEYGWSARPVTFRGKDYLESRSAPPDPQSISRIWFAPNHFRAWRREFYWKVGGHNGAMKISDDHDLMCRTYIAGKMVQIDKPLYLYRVHGANTWLLHADEIQTTMWGCHDKYIYDMAMKWSRDKNLKCIDLCGGIDKPAGYESIDQHHGDISADLNQAWPLADNSVGLIRAHDAIEHLRDPIHTMNEAWRVLAHGGFFLIMVPSSEGVGADCDPTHVSRWNWRSFRYYTESVVRRYIEHAGCRCRFQKIKVENKMLYDGVLYVVAHLVAIKQEQPRFYGELKI